MQTAISPAPAGGPEFPKILSERAGVSVKDACRILSVGQTRLYALLRDGELQSYLEGAARRITTASIRARLERLIAAGGKSALIQSTSRPAQAA